MYSTCTMYMYIMLYPFTCMVVHALKQYMGNTIHILVYCTIHEYN